MLLGSLVMMVIYALYEPTGVYAALEADAGTRGTIRGAWAVAWKKAGRYIWLALVRTLILMLPIMVFGGVIAGTIGLSMARAHGNSVTNGLMVILPLIMLLYIGSIAYAILIMLRLVLAVPACVAENVSAWTGIRRSNQLTCGAKGRIFLMGLLMYAIVYVAFLVVELVLFLLVSVAALAGMLLHVGLAPWGFIGIGVVAIVLFCALVLYVACIWAAYTTMFAVIYHDQRLRLEGVAPAVVPTA
jgi:membrane-anchored glycerophosphoryl diester phosphodiesterase (GDPDase)